MAKKTTRSARGKSRPTTTVGDVCAALQQIAPLELAQGWDNVGLLAGDRTAPVRRMLLCIDLTPPVAREAVRGRYDLVMAYHPPIFKPVPRLTAQDAGPESAVFRCITAGIAVYSTHTALDAAEGGTNDVIAGFCDITATEPLDFSPSPRPAEVKIIVFIPADCTDAVADAMFAAGAGHIGEYRKCSYRLDGRGTFLGSAATNPAVGRKQRFETVAETRLEMVCPEPAVPRVLAAMRAAHPYESRPAMSFRCWANRCGASGEPGNCRAQSACPGLAAKLKRATGGGRRSDRRQCPATPEAGDHPGRSSWQLALYRPPGSGRRDHHRGDSPSRRPQHPALRGLCHRPGTLDQRATGAGPDGRTPAGCAARIAGGGQPVRPRTAGRLLTAA
jgi:putative NIF3 family GTP cyclohydrolase 1 type 2